MRFGFREFFIRCVVCVATLFSTQALFAAPPSGYYMVWSDEFNGTALDTTKWDYWLLGNRRDAVNVANAISVGGGNLTITTYTTNGTHYTGMIATDGTFRSRYGYWEASIKWGDTNGMWSAFWMQSPTMGTWLFDPWSSGSEIDIVEHRYVDGSGNNISGIVQNNIHWNGYGSSAASAGSGNIGSGLGAGFHTYGSLWTPTDYTLYVDGANLRNWNYSNNGVPVSRSTEWTILSSEVDDTSTTWAGTIPPGGYGNLGVSTTKLTVDYVRYYAPTNTIFWTGASSSDLNNSANYVATMPPLFTSDITFSQLSGNNLSPTLGANLSVDSLVFTWMNNSVTLGGANTLTLGGGGVDMASANHTVTLACPIAIGANQTWTVGINNPGNTLNANSPVSGSATLTKAGWGTLILNGTNSFSGTLNVDTASSGSAPNDISDGIVRITRSENVASVPTIAIRNNNSAYSTLQLSAAINNIVVPANISLAARNTNVPAIENLSGSNLLSGNLSVNVGGGYYIFQSDAGTLNFGGVISSAASGARNLTFQGAGDHLISGSIQNGSATTMSVTKSDSGNLIFANASTFNGALSVGGGAVKINNPLALQNIWLDLPWAGSNALKFGPVTTASVGTLSGLNDIWLTNSSLAAVTLTNGANNSSSTYLGALRGPGSFVKAGSGTTTLDATNAYTGATIVSGGTLKFGTATNIIASLQPVLWFNFDSAGSGVVTNLGTGGWAMNGTLIGNGAYVTNAGRFGNALYVDGNGSSAATNIVLIANKVVDTSASGSWTVGYWVKTLTPGAVILYQGDGGWSGNGETTYYLNTAGTAAGGTNAGAVRYAGGWLTGTKLINDGAWHFVTLVDSAGTESIYVDGNPDARRSAMNLALISGANQTWIGGSPDGGDGTAKMNGMIDEVCMFPRALSLAEVRAIYTNAPLNGKLPAASAVSVASGATLDLSGISQTIASLADYNGSGGIVTNSGAATTLNISGSSGSATFSGTIADSAANPISLSKSGGATQILTGNNTYRGTTFLSTGSLLINGSIGSGAVTVSGGTFGGNGIIGGAVTVLGGIFSPGTSIGRLTVNNNVTLQSGGTTLMEISHDAATNDSLVVSGTLQYGGTLTVNNLSGALAPGDSFKLFTAGNNSGAFAATNLPSLNPGYGWNFNPASGVLSVVQTVSTTPTNMSFSVSGNTLTLSWPDDHIGWRLQVQTNDVNVGLGTNWVDVPDSTTTNQLSVPMDNSMSAVFYRMIFP